MPINEDDAKAVKAMVALARKNPVNIGICMGLKPDKAVVVMDRKRDPEVLGREAKKKGETAKIAVGTIAVDGRTATLTCIGKTPSGLAKQLKAYFKLIEIPLVFDLLDEDGNAVADEDDSGSDARDGAGPAGSDDARVAWETTWAEAAPRVDAAIAANPVAADKLRLVRDFTLAKAADGDFPSAQKSLQTLFGLMAAGKPSGQTAEATAPATAAPAISPKDLIEKLQKLKPRIAAISGPDAADLNAAYLNIVNMLKAGTLGAASEGVEGLTSAVARAEAATTATAKSATDPKFAKIAEAAEKLRVLVNALSASAGRSTMLDLLDGIAAKVSDGEAEVALGGLKRVQDGLKLQAEVDRLSPLVSAAASAGKVADVNAMTLLFNAVAEAVPAADHAKAMTNLAKVAAMITAGTAEPSAFAREVPADVQPFAISRIEWGKTRGKMRNQIEMLQDAIIKACDAAGELKEVSDSVGELLDHLLGLDDRLESKLDEIVNSETGAKREALKKEARTLLSEYAGELAKPFFADVDSNNGFTNVAVTSTARAALAEISNVLAA